MFLKFKVSSVYFLIIGISRSEKKIAKKKKKNPSVDFTNPRPLGVSHEAHFVLFSPNCLTSEKLVLTCHPSSQWQIKRGRFSQHTAASHSDTLSFPAGSCRGAACVWTVWPPCIIQEMSLLYLWRASCSPSFGSSREGVGLGSTPSCWLMPQPHSTWPWLSSHLPPKKVHLFPWVLGMFGCTLTWDV